MINDTKPGAILDILGSVELSSEIGNSTVPLGKVTVENHHFS